MFAITFAIGAGLAGLGRRRRRHGAVDLAGRGHALPAGLAGGGDRRRHGQRRRAPPIGALLIGLAEQFGLAYAPTYSVVFTFVIMVLVLAFRPRGHHGEERMSAAAVAPGDEFAARRRSAWSRPPASAARPGRAPAARRAAAAPAQSIAGALRTIGVRHVVVLLVVLVYPWVATPFFTYPDRRARRWRSA